VIKCKILEIQDVERTLCKYCEQFYFTTTRQEIIRYIYGSVKSRSVFIGSGNCDVSGDHWIQSQRRRWSMASSLLASTTKRTAGAPKATTDTSQRILNGVAHLFSDRGLGQLACRLSLARRAGTSGVQARVHSNCLYHKQQSVKYRVTRLPGT